MASATLPLRFPPAIILCNRYQSLPCSTKHFKLSRVLGRRLSYSAAPGPPNPATRAVISDAPTEKPQYPKIAAEPTGPIPPAQLLEVVEAAAKSGAEVVMEAVNKPRNISYKGTTDLVTDTDKSSESAILETVRKDFTDHLVLGEEGGLIGNTVSDYLWCIDPLDGTTNFAHGYPSFAVSVGVLFRGKPAAASVVVNSNVDATVGGGAFCNGQKIHVSQTNQVEKSLLVTGFGYEHDEPWVTNMNLFKEFTDISRGVRRLGAAAVDMSHVALGIVESYWEYRLKPWDMAAGVLIVEEAGGTVTRMDGGPFCVFDRSVLVSNGLLHSKRKEEGKRKEAAETVLGGVEKEGRLRTMVATPGRKQNWAAVIVLTSSND
ncbi:hypothetical protein QJS04_geneDACA017531 [Acorus gramineus]|uniref:Inositol-1-monophosphatase n=1 Tax=Acorus gramineus TaxID=55184 RepID=A0AAV9BRT4_ACOGR|nr:hypothetical protein QJS04_geneDACA017531 [Acorus gramineus]